MEAHSTVREGYQIILLAQSEQILPKECEKMREYYQNLSAACMQWATGKYGEEVRQAFLRAETVREKSAFGIRKFRLRIRQVFEEYPYCAVLCEAKLSGKQNAKDCYHRLSHVWNAEEETILPFSQILELFHARPLYKSLAFRPDGIYPEGEALVLFRNATPETPFCEKRIPLNRSEIGQIR